MKDTNKDDIVTGGAGHGPDQPINQAASTLDEEPAFASSTPDAPPIAEPGGIRDLQRLATGDREQAGQRSAAEILDDHLSLSQNGTVDEDLSRNFATDLVVLAAKGAFHGFGGMRFLAQELTKELPQAHFIFKTRLVEGRMALVEWSGEGDGGTYVENGVDSYLIEDGKIRALTIHYTVKRR